MKVKISDYKWYLSNTDGLYAVSKKDGTQYVYGEKSKKLKPFDYAMGYDWMGVSIEYVKSVLKNGYTGAYA